jgi:hypothetical protein
MSWQFIDSSDPDELRMRIQFLQSSVSQRGSSPFRPRYVPGRIRIDREVRSEMPAIFSGVARPGEYDCSSNQWGAISVIADNGKEIGIRPSECVVISMTKNQKWRES